nr:MAG TPA: hypothetical protein [Caudoviricetes sp.]
MVTYILKLSSYYFVYKRKDEYTVQPHTIIQTI